jgi:prepilin-type processing-associated H-X9-DG protein
MNQYVGESTRSPDPRVHYVFQPGTVQNASKMFLFIDEHEDSIDDGYFLLPFGIQTVGWENVPASRHNKGVQLAFVDGHAEKHRWKDSRTLYPIQRTRLFAVPQPNSKDTAWLVDHAIFPK